MRRVVVESPYAGDIELNVAYARRAVRDCVNRGESPIASHLLFTQPGILNDDDRWERERGIEAGLAWMRVADAAVFYLDRGMSRGMLAAHTRAKSLGITIEYRFLGAEQQAVA